MSDDEEDDYYGDDDDDGDGRLDLGTFLGEEDTDEDFDDDDDLSDEEKDEKAAIKQIIEGVNREEAREVFESMKNPDDGYPESDLDAFITEWAYEFYDNGHETIDWSSVS